jgi:hypothetical protein
MVDVLAATPDVSPSELEQLYRGYVPRGLGGVSMEMDDIRAMDFSVRYTSGKEVWDYGGIVLTFEDWSGTENYKMIPDQNNDLPTYIKEKPDLYEPDFGGKEFNLYGYYSTFRGEKGKTILDLSFAIPTRQVEFNPYLEDWARTDLDRGLFLFDNEWDEVFRNVQSEPLYVRTERDTVPDELIVDQRYIELDPGLYHMSVEVQDKKTKNTSVSRRELLLPEYDFMKLQLSDIVAAQKIDIDNQIGYTRKDIKIENNPSRVFRKSWIMHVYYEIYNLLPDPSGRTRYRIETMVAEPGWKRRSGVSRFFHQLSQFFSGTKDNAYISLASEYRGSFHTQARYETIDIHNLTVQRYLLNIRVTDLVRNTSIEKDFLFAVTRDFEEGLMVRTVGN